MFYPCLLSLVKLSTYKNAQASSPENNIWCVHRTQGLRDWPSFHLNFCNLKLECSKPQLGRHKSAFTLLGDPYFQHLP